MKKILILLIGLAFAQASLSIQTKEFTIPVSSEQTIYDVTDYITLVSGKYALKLLEATNIQISCSGCYNNYVLTPKSCSGLDENSWLMNLSNNGIFISDESQCTELELTIGEPIEGDDVPFTADVTYRIVGSFEDEHQNQIDDIYDLLGGITSGDMNLDGTINVVDIVALVNIIIGEES